VPKIKFFEWFDETIGGNLDREDEDRSLECSLVRSMSDLRKQELKNHKLSGDFHKNLLLEISKTEQDPISYKSKFLESINIPAVRFALSGIVLLSFSFYLYSLNISRMESSAKTNKIDQTVETAMVEEDDEIDELDVLADLKKGQEDIDLLKKLEAYYTVHGYIEKADKVHFKLETISK